MGNVCLECFAAPPEAKTIKRKRAAALHPDARSFARCADAINTEGDSGCLAGPRGAMSDDVLSVLLRGVRLPRNPQPDAAASSSSTASTASCGISAPVFQLPAGLSRRPARGKAEPRASGDAAAERADVPVDFFSVYGEASAGSRRAAKPRKAAEAALSATSAGEPGASDEEAPAGDTGPTKPTTGVALRRKNRIYVKAGADVLIPPPFASFADALAPLTSCTAAAEPVQQSTQKTCKRARDAEQAQQAPAESIEQAVLSLPTWLRESLKRRGVEKPTPIQMQARHSRCAQRAFSTAIPLLLGRQHLLATAPTGSGKTFAFLLPLIALLKKPGKEFARLLVICPSRELARQTQREFDSLAGARGFRCRLLDEQKLRQDQTSSVKRLDAAITTPLRLVQFLRDGRVSLAQCRHVVLDEADKLLDLGFAPQLDEILASCTCPRLQVCLFSATLPPEVLRLADSLLHNPIHISIGAPNAAASSIEQELLFCTNEEGKLLALRTLHLTGKFIPPVLIFVQSKERAKHLYCELVYDGIFVECIHADKTKKQRDDIVEAFRRGQIWVLICTDVMARGVDFKNVELVINYDFPQSAAVYIHRIGRTGRAGRRGRAITFYTTADIPHLRSVVGVMQQTSTCQVPEWLQKMGKMTAKQKRDLQRRAPERKPILTTPAIDVRREKQRQQAIEASKAKKKRKLEASRVSGSSP
ncbi:DEAD/DEAH box helicase domain-containing protein [Besnoitia besnoiti]|uniref:RNA helicase n=1 Tax=Besnoitia besnoiti TaxID=94643 RepID=A0A2A9M705_BESBE|nr:DEAD/DEAH box helicase domain-containing protein [Besnoitia besnoiti]PFH31190.1 DEAD/DEAH box helicase domain-containing protein [Besnoitia besnoiti]